MIKRLIIMLLLVGVVFGGIFGYKAHQIKEGMAMMKNMKQPPVHVSTAFATTENWERELHAVGSVTAVDSINLAAEVSGTISAIHFDSGDSVKAGDLILELESSTEKASLKSAVANAKLASINYERQLNLRERTVNTQADLDQAQASRDQALAAVELAQANLDKKQIHAPFDGQLGLRHVSQGQFLQAGSSIVYLQSTSPVYIDFSLPQNQFQLVSKGFEVRAKVENNDGKTFIGSILSITPMLEESTRQARVRAVFDNPDGLLTPGMFANVTIELPTEDPFIVVPNTSISYNPYGNVVYLVGDDNTVKQIFVKTGLTRGDLVSITDGLEEGQQIVTTGQLKLRNGSSIIVDNDVTPSAEENPNPEES